MRAALRISIAAIAAFIFAASVLTTTSAQRLGIFSHNTRAHKEGKYKDCSSCHTLPTKNWLAARPDKQAPFPDVNTFPSHISCFGCHVKDIYSNGGAFCGSCHVVPTMQARAVLAFPIASHATQFMTVFPHDVHQNLIAQNITETDTASAHFMASSHGPSFLDDTPQFQNCAICHRSASTLPKIAPRTTAGVQALADAATETFAPKAEFFKDSPFSHASCFNCHYQNAKPTGTDCAGCHSLSAPYARSTTLARYSLKFNHNDKDHVNKDCTVCHIRITQNSDVRKMKDADVPILACSTSSCHGGGRNNGALTDPSYPLSAIANEIGMREDSIAAKKAVFQCTYCHSTSVGRFPVPPSHKSR
jgi:hypothetical protein